MKITVGLVDDSDVVRRGLRTLLELDGEIEIVGEAADGDAALELVARLHPDIVLLDVRMPRRDGLSVVAELSDSTKVLMMTFSDEPAVIRSALEAGAIGYLVHGTFDAGALSSIVRSAAAGSRALSGPALDAVFERGPAPLAAAKEFDLSPRQSEVMDLVAGGHTNGSIARTLFLTEKTVKNHINQIFTKLGASNRGQAIALWLGTAQR